MAHCMTGYERAKRNRNHIARELAKPARKAAEQQFARDHADDTDEELYALRKEMKRKHGKHLKPVKTVGLLYFEARLGLWTDVMGRINRELAEEKQKFSPTP